MSRDANQFAAVVAAVAPCPDWKATSLGMAFDGGVLDPVKYFVCMTKHIPRECSSAFVARVRSSSLHMASRTVNTLVAMGVLCREDLKPLSVYAMLTDVGALPEEEFLIQCWTAAREHENQVFCVWERLRVAREKQLGLAPEASDESLIHNEHRLLNMRLLSQEF